MVDSRTMMVDGASPPYQLLLASCIFHSAARNKKVCGLPIFFLSFLFTKKTLFSSDFSFIILWYKRGQHFNFVIMLWGISNNCDRLSAKEKLLPISPPSFFFSKHLDLYSYTGGIYNQHYIMDIIRKPFSHSIKLGQFHFGAPGAAWATSIDPGHPL